MQPIPPSITTTIFSDAARGFARAAGSLGTGAAAAELRAAARSTFQGIPSLRMTTTGTAELAAQLQDAADAALALSDRIAAAPTGSDFASYRDAVLGWSRLADAAAAELEPAARYWG